MKRTSASSKQARSPLTRLKTPFFVLVIAVLTFWNFRLQRENHRLADRVREARRLAEHTPAPSPALQAIDPALAARLSDERDAVEALAQRLQEAGVPDVSGLKRAVSNQEEVVADLHQEMKRLIASRPAQLDDKTQRQQLSEQIDAEARLITQLKAKVLRYKASKKKEQRAEVPSLVAQVEAENQVVHDLKEQRANVGKTPREPAAAETPEQSAERAALEKRLQTETERLEKLKADLEAGRQAPVDEEARRVRQELDKHQASLRQLENQAKAETQAKGLK